MPGYKPREKNVIQEILQDHFNSFEENYNTQYSEKYGKYRIIYIKETVKRFVECGDYSKGIARIKCTITTCGHEYFRPSIASLKVACKSWYLCPSCDPQDVGSAGEDRMSEMQTEPCDRAKRGSAIGRRREPCKIRVQSKTQKDN